MSRLPTSHREEIRRRVNKLTDELTNRIDEHIARYRERQGHEDYRPVRFALRPRMF